MSLLPWLALATAATFVLTRKGRSSSYAGAGAPAALYAGVPYLFIVRLEASDEMARATLEPKGAADLEMSPATTPPFWAEPGAAYSTRVAAFRATPQGNSTVSLGEPFYGIGRLEKVVRLDGQPFNASPSAMA